MGRKTVVMLVVLAVGFVAGSDAVAAVVHTVTDCGDTTPGGAPGQLRRLISDAAPGDTIDVPACLIVLAGTAGEDANAVGDLDVTKDLTIRGAGARRTIIDGGAVDRVFDVFAPATVTLSDLMIRNGLNFVGGGGLRNTGALTLDRVVVRDSQTVDGGGIHNGGTLTATEISVVGNVVTAPGGSFVSGGGIVNQGTMTLTRSTVSGNSALGDPGGQGGGIVNVGTLALVDSTVSGNLSIGAAGGVLNGLAGTLISTGSAIVANSSGSSPAGLRHDGTATLTNTVIANNLTFSQCLMGAAVTSGGGNLVTDGSCGLTGPGDTVVADPGLGPLSDQGGPTATHPLLPGSPAIDTAQPGPCGPTDQRGVTRPRDGNGDTTAVCDRGPFEVTPPVFADVPADHLARGATEALWINGVTGGCAAAPLRFCPDDAVTRGQMAVLLLRARQGPGFTPPPATGIFADVPVGHLFAPWIEAAFNMGITGGCAASPSRYCPDDPVTRGQIAILLTRTLSVIGFVPPPASGIFVDVPPGDFQAPWIEEFLHRGLTGGCAAPAYCPSSPVSRAQAAIFLVRAFGLGF